MVGAAFTAALAGVLSAITAVEFYYFLNLQPGAATATTTSAAARAVSASVGEFEILVALVVAVGAFYVAVALIYRHIHQAEAAAAAGAGNRPLSDRVGALLLAAAGLLEFFLFVPVVPSLPCATDIVGALGLAAFRALPAAATATFFLGMMLLLIIVAHVRAGGEGGGGDFVGDIVTAVPGTTEPERRIEERGTAFWMQFYTVGTKTFPRSRPRNGVPGTRNARSFPFPGD